MASRKRNHSSSDSSVSSGSCDSVRKRVKVGGAPDRATAQMSNHKGASSDTAREHSKKRKRREKAKKEEKKKKKTKQKEKKKKKKKKEKKAQKRHKRHTADKERRQLQQALEFKKALDADKEAKARFAARRAAFALAQQQQPEMKQKPAPKGPLTKEVCDTLIVLYVATQCIICRCLKRNRVAFEKCLTQR